ncbi:MAG: hypothetical protein COZ96_04775, partial [Nitrospirae bacterium CG_4_8_14_3_um_filter_70_85]
MISVGARREVPASPWGERQAPPQGEAGRGVVACGAGGLRAIARCVMAAPVAVVLPIVCREGAKWWLCRERWRGEARRGRGQAGNVATFTAGARDLGRRHQFRVQARWTAIATNR